MYTCTYMWWHWRENTRLFWQSGEIDTFTTKYIYIYIFWYGLNQYNLTKVILCSCHFLGRLTLSISLYFPISEWAVIRHPNTRNFPPGSEVFSSTLVQTCRALSVWLDWYNLRPFSICCLVWSWPISGARRLIKVFIRLGHAISVRRQESRSSPCAEQLPRKSLQDDPPQGRCQTAYQILLPQLRLCWDGEETESAKIKRQHTKTIITSRF